MHLVGEWNHQKKADAESSGIAGWRKRWKDFPFLHMNMKEKSPVTLKALLSLRILRTLTSVSYYLMSVQCPHGVVM